MRRSTTTSKSSDRGDGAVVAYSRSGTQQPDNVYAERSTATSQFDLTDRARIQWAWMADTANDSKRKLVKSIDGSSVRNELLDVVRVLSSSAVETQTSAPSYVMAINDVHMETDRHRSIATQIGVPKEKSNRATQVVEADLVHVRRGDSGNPYASMRATARVDSDERVTDGLNPWDDDEGGTLFDTSQREAEGYSEYHPTCAVPSSSYPLVVGEARHRGIANKYGFVSLPQHVVELPPRRRKKFIAPVEVSFLYGAHDLHLEDTTTTHLSRAHSLWTQCTGFVPKF